MNVQFIKFQSLQRQSESWKIGDRVPVRKRNFSLLHSIQTASDPELLEPTHRAIQCVSGVPSSGLKRLGYGGDHRPPFTAESRIVELQIPLNLHGVMLN
jgi:hypothetical protein